MLNTTELEIIGMCTFEPDEIRYLPIACSKIQEHVQDGTTKFKRLLFCEQYELAYDVFCDLLNSDESMAFDILMHPNVKEMFLNVREFNFKTRTISEEIIHSFRETLESLFDYYNEHFQHRLNNQKDWG